MKDLFPICRRGLAFILAFVLIFTSMLKLDVDVAKAETGTITFSESAGYEEGVYAEWAPVTGADGYKAYVSSNGSTFTAVDNELIREYADYWRVDVVGLAAGTYSIKVEAVTVDAATKETTVIASGTTEGLTVTNYDRSGFAFSSNTGSLGSGSGAYNDDGTLKSGAQVIYVTSATAKTCKATVNGEEVTGIQAILDMKQKSNTSNDILCIRIIGKVSASDLDSMSSSSEGLQIKGNSEYTPMNITIEGIGEDATVHGFGFLVRNCGNVEFRNFAIMCFMDDGISIDSDNTNIWVHDMDLFYGSTGGDADQAKGDGTVDLKGDSKYITISYNHFWDSGKASLCGMKSETGPNYITYHHNWFDHSDSRHPRIRTMSVHVYNNYYDGNSKYGVGAAYQSDAFVEANYFNNCKLPMLISMQGSDISQDPEGKGTFSGEDGGIIKAFNNVVIGAQSLVYANSDAGTSVADPVEFDAYLVSSRTETVPSTVTAKQGGHAYNNFDTTVDLGVKEEAIDAPENVPTVVSARAGRLNGGDFKWDLSAESEDSNYAVISELKSAVVNYVSSVVSIGGIEGVTTGSGSTGGTTGGGTTGGGTVATGDVVHNFTESGKASDFFSITGNLSTSKGTVTYGELTLTQCLKMESSTNISFTAAGKGTLTLVFDSAKSSNVKVDGEKYTLTNGILELELEAGAHTITKADSANLFYMVLAYEGGGSTSGGDTPSDDPIIPEDPTLTNTVEDFVKRMYTVALGRDAEEAGVETWVAALNAGTHDGAGIAEEFVLGDEFAMRGLTDEQYVDTLYQTFFNRAADEGGKELWLAVLASGQTRGYVLSNFVNLEEFTMLCAQYGIERGVMLPDGVAAKPGISQFVKRMYTVVLGRDAENEGLYNNVLALVVGAETAESVAKNFFGSEEYVMKNKDNEAYVRDLYNTFMNREADATGLSFWVETIAVGMSREEVLSEFAKSEEFKAIAASYGLN